MQSIQKKVSRVSSKLGLRRFVLTDRLEAVLYKCRPNALSISAPDLFQLWSNCLGISFFMFVFVCLFFYFSPNLDAQALHIC